jgi:hypothetical protein
MPEDTNGTLRMIRRNNDIRPSGYRRNHVHETSDGIISQSAGMAMNSGIPINEARHCSPSEHNPRISMLEGRLPCDAPKLTLLLEMHLILKEPSWGGPRDDG